MFKSNTGDNVTREEAREYIAGVDQRLVTARTAVEAQVNDLSNRVTALEALAAGLRSSGVPTRTLPVREPGVTLGEVLNTAATAGIDYGAIAFGLSEIKRNVSNAATIPGAAEFYAGTVQYFADVFAKSDPGFDEASFKRQAGVSGGGTYERSHP